ncbi:MAG TPA: hypothetical protein EYP59_12010 [Thiotrichaceae bacterium]|nr:hypothetical protein [Thiotrichaceae bacterium]
MSKKLIKWHDLIGLGLIDLFKCSNFEVKTEQNMSIKPQYVDVLIISKSNGKPLDNLPDGFEFLTDHNILTYKSLNESLNQWAIAEVLGHYVSYRKIVSPKDKLLPESKFQIYAICTHYPQKLLGPENKLGAGIKKIKAGIYKISLPFIKPIIILVLSQMALQEPNALWQLFSGNAVGFEYGDAHYKWHDPEDKSLLNQLYHLYLKEGVHMSYTFEEFHRDYTMPFIESLPIEMRLKGIPPEEVFKQFSPDDVFKQFTPSEIEAYLLKLKKETH